MEIFDFSYAYGVANTLVCCRNTLYINICLHLKMNPNIAVGHTLFLREHDLQDQVL